MPIELNQILTPEKKSLLVDEINLELNDIKKYVLFTFSDENSSELSIEESDLE